MLQPRIVVDFDGTICHFAYPGIGDPKPGVRESLSELRRLGYYIVISSCRTCHHHPEIFAPTGVTGVEAEVHKAMVAYLDVNEIPYDEIDNGAKGKHMAGYYIDDKGVRYEDNWPEIVEFIKCRM